MTPDGASRLLAPPDAIGMRSSSAERLLLIGLLAAAAALRLMVLEGRVEVLLNNLAAHPPFDRIAKRIELQRRLNAVLGLEVSDVATEAATWHSIDAAYLLSPGAFGQFTEAFEWVAEQLATSETGG